jgi:SprT-like protein
VNEESSHSNIRQPCTADHNELQKWVESISLKDFGKPFRHRAVFNPRLRTTGGRYFLHDHRIEINPKHLEQLGKEVVLGIIRHELCHYHLHLEGKGYRHRDVDFQRLLKKVKGLRHAPALSSSPAKKSRGFRYVLICQTCGQKAYRRKRMDPARYVCGACGGSLRLEALSEHPG